MVPSRAILKRRAISCSISAGKLGRAVTPNFLSSGGAPGEPPPLPTGATATVGDALAVWEWLHGASVATAFAGAPATPANSRPGSANYAKVGARSSDDTRRRRSASFHHDETRH